MLRIAALLAIACVGGWMLPATTGMAKGAPLPPHQENSAMGTPEGFRAAMERYLLIQEDLKNHAKSHGVKIKFSPLKVQVNPAGGRVSIATTPAAPDGGTSCTTALQSEVADQLVEVKATASTCPQALDQAELALKQAVMDLMDLLHQLGRL